MKREIEVLAPAGSMECLKAAVLNGADAVYLGGELFGARAYAGNFKKEELCEVIDYAHLFGKKIFLTINTLVKEKELDDLPGFLKPYYEQGLDAVIIQDLGVLQTVREHFPDLEIHASTQMTITGVYGARIAKKMGAQRVVPARELSLSEIKAIKDDTGLDMECFVHGALCYCYSGQCFMSSMLGGRSGNRGRCAGTCRLPFSVQGGQASKNAYPLSLKDLCTIEQLPEILEHGVDSLKIEGRMKGARYVGEVTRIYRKYVDLYLSGAEYKVEEEDRKILLELFNRGGFTDGYYKQYHGKQMMSMKRPGHQGMMIGQIQKIKKGTLSFVTKEDLHKGDVLELEISPEEKVELTCPAHWKSGSMVTLNGQKMKKLYVGMEIIRTMNQELTGRIDETLKGKKKENLKGKIILRTNESAKLFIDNGSVSVWTEGAVMEKARNQGAVLEDVKKQILKTGETHYQFTDFSVEMEEGLFVPGSVLKKLRRDAFAALDRKMTEKYRRIYHAPNIHEESKEAEQQSGQPALTVSLENIDLLPEVLKSDAADRIYLSLAGLWKKDHPEMILKQVKDAGKQCFLMLPHIARKKQMDKMQASADLLESPFTDGLLVRNLEEFSWLTERKYDGEIVLDYMLYAYNRKAAAKYEQLYGKKLKMTYPEECTRQEMKMLQFSRGEFILYGHLPLMVSAQCVKCNLKGCNQKEEWLVLTDRYKKEFFVHNDCEDCINEIYNGQPVWLGTETGLAEEFGLSAYRLHFTKETPKEVDELLRAAKEVQKGRKASPMGDFTKGHLKRGIL